MDWVVGLNSKIGFKAWMKLLGNVFVVGFYNQIRFASVKAGRKLLRFCYRIMNNSLDKTKF